MLNSCVMHHHTGPAPGIVVWNGIGYHSRTSLVHIAGTLNCQRYISEILELVFLPYLQGLATAIFQQDNALQSFRRGQEFGVPRGNSSFPSYMLPVGQWHRGSYIGKLPLWPTDPLCHCLDFRYGPEHKKSGCHSLGSSSCYFRNNLVVG
ncbi:transposable element Tcb1 transposase [Trichonephila clavipes]|nr:transposable element Tcb1 transposase [Trichonephila clavipes]